MPAPIQDWLAAALAVVAAAWLARRAWRRRRRVCAGCESCPLAEGTVAGAAPKESAIPSFVPLESLRASR